MRVAVISDIHANLPALEAVLVDAGDVQEIWCPGDIVGYGASPNECIALLRSLNARAIAGNHDWAAIGRLPIDHFNPDARAAAEWTGRQLTVANREYLEALDLTLRVDPFTIAHGTLRNPLWEYLVSPAKADDSFTLLQTAYCLVGHTHLPVVYLESAAGKPASSFASPFDRPVRLGAERLIINPGSVGQPRDGIPDASYIIYDTGAKEIHYRRVPYNVASAQRMIQAAHLPPRLWQRLSQGW